tara:strand:+ start:190 stop:474 length:285 start_codon:yes stop_codon:yes gene_type:complete
MTPTGATSSRPDVQPLDVGGAIYAIGGFAMAAFYMLLWYVAPGFMEASLWSGSSIPWSMLLGTLVIIVPVLLAWLCSRKDVESASDETYEVAGH